MRGETEKKSRACEPLNCLRLLNTLWLAKQKAEKQLKIFHSQFVYILTCHRITVADTVVVLVSHHLLRLISIVINNIEFDPDSVPLCHLQLNPPPPSPSSPLASGCVNEGNFKIIHIYIYYIEVRELKLKQSTFCIPLDWHRCVRKFKRSPINLD